MGRVCDFELAFDLFGQYAFQKLSILARIDKALLSVCIILYKMFSGIQRDCLKTYITNKRYLNVHILAHFCVNFKHVFLLLLAHVWEFCNALLQKCCEEDFLMANFTSVALKAGYFHRKLFYSTYTVKYPKAKMRFYVAIYS